MFRFSFSLFIHVHLLPFHVYWFCNVFLLAIILYSVTWFKILTHMSIRVFLVAQVPFFLFVFSVKFSRASKRKQYVLLPFVFSRFLRAFVKAFLCDNLFSFLFFVSEWKHQWSSHWNEYCLCGKFQNWGEATTFTSAI